MKKGRRNRSGVSNVIAVMLMIVVAVAAAITTWALASGSIGSSQRGTTGPTPTVIQINSATSGNTEISVQIVISGADSRIVAVYINGHQTTTDTFPKAWSTGNRGEVMQIRTPKLNVGDAVQVFCADGGTTSTNVILT